MCYILENEKFRYGKNLESTEFLFEYLWLQKSYQLKYKFNYPKRDPYNPQLKNEVFYEPNECENGINYQVSISNC